MRANAGAEIDYEGGVSVGGNLSGPGVQAVLTGGATFSSATASVLTIFNGVSLNIGAPTTFNQVNNSGVVTVAAGQTLAWNDGQNDQGTLTINGTVNATGWTSTGVIAINNGGAVNNSASNLALGGGSRTTINVGGTLTAASGTSIELNGALLVNNGTQNGNLNINYGSQARGTGVFGNVSVGPGGQFGNNAPATGTGNLVAPVSPTFALVSGPSALNAQPFVGPQFATTPQTTNVANLALNGGGALNFNLQNTQEPAGTGYDLTNVGGQLTLSGSAAPGDQIIIRVIGLDGNGDKGTVATFDPAQGYALTPVHTGNGIVGYTASEFVVNTTDFANNTRGGTFAVVQQGNDLVLLFTPVPEPGTWTLLALGAGGLLLLARRRSRRGSA